MSGKMRIFWTAVNWLGFFALALWVNAGVMNLFGDRVAAILLLIATIAAIAVAIRFIVLFVRKRTRAGKTPEPVCVSAEDHGSQN